MELLKVENLSFAYPKQQQKALDNISFSLMSGEFIVICGESGCGKTTLLKMLKPVLTPYGEKDGKVFFEGIDVQHLDERRAVSDIGYVLQNPDSQIVTDKVWHELAFGLENMGLPTQTIRRRVNEMACFFGLDGIFRSETASLSGGQKQLLNLASIMVMSPKLLILDEPTSQLDPIAASGFIATLQKINRELGLTILLVEHRLEEVFPIADRVILMEKGAVSLFEHPRDIGQSLKKKQHEMILGLPSAVRIFYQLNIDDDCPLTVREGRAFLTRHYGDTATPYSPPPPAAPKQNYTVEVKDVWFRYERDLPDVLEGIHLTLFEGETVCILGGNGAGKTTLLKVLSAQERAYRGKININDRNISKYSGNELYRGNLALLPQNPQTVFLKSTIKEDYMEICKVMGYKKDVILSKINEIAGQLELECFLERHPYDLSGGEQQKAALGKMLLLNPRILLLDEPTKGIDAYSKHKLGKILAALKKQHMTILIVTHDVEFAAENADRCAMLFDKGISSIDAPADFFSGNQFYTTAANRIARHLFPSAITCGDVVFACRQSESRSFTPVQMR
ncbi:MAG: ABC transporter ATP-binding protein [Christensenellales bacterium]